MRQRTERDHAVGPTVFSRAIGRALTGALAARGMTQTDLAAATGIPRSVISRICNGKQNPTIARVEYLFDHLDVTLDVTTTPAASGGDGRPRAARRPGSPASVAS